MCGCALQISERERAQSRASRLQRRKAANDALAALRRGDIITITQGRRGGLAVVLEADRDSDDPRPLVLTEHRWAGRISSADYSGASAPVGSMSLPKRVEHRQPRVRRDLASALRSAAAGLDVPSAKAQAQRPADGAATSTPSWRRCASSCAGIRAHGLPDREAKARLAERYLRIERDNEQIRQKIAAATNSLARTFDRIVGLLTERGFIDGDGRRSEGDRRRPAAGADLQRERPAGRRVPAQRRLGGTGRRRAGGGAVVGALRVARRRGRARRDGVDVPTGKLRRALNADPPAVGRSCAPTSSGTASRRAASPTTASSPAIYRWATTGDLTTALAASDVVGHRDRRLSAGDFVRWCRQVLDLLDQVRNAAPDAGAAGHRETRDQRHSTRRRRC